VLNEPKSGEAMQELLYALPKSEVVEFNVYKYAHAGRGKWLVAAQYAFRFNLGELDGKEVRKLRLTAVDLMASFDMAGVRAFFDKLR
jgi:hypothetical protein